ncbi:MAG: hypothetical protein LBC51_09885 [Treponema sp.]|jgi:hypothetical protein|nr:hypothetical protein [Treponema sp.]
MSYSIKVGVKGADQDVEALRVLLRQAVQGACPVEEINDFFDEIRIRTKNPLKKGEREFSFSENEDFMESAMEEPYSFCSAMSEAFPELRFFIITYPDSDDGHGVEYRIYRNGKAVEEQNYFYYGGECGGYSCTYVPANACEEWIQAKYRLWRIRDEGDTDAIAEAEKAERKAYAEWSYIHDFLLDGGIDALDMDAGILRLQNEADLKVLRLLEAEGGYKGFSITEVETVDMNAEGYCEEWEELPDLTCFTGMKTLILTGCSNIAELPQYIAEKAKAGELEIVGWD